MAVLLTISGHFGGGLFVVPFLLLIYLQNFSLKGLTFYLQATGQPAIRSLPNNVQFVCRYGINRRLRRRGATLGRPPCDA